MGVRKEGSGKQRGNASKGPTSSSRMASASYETAADVSEMFVAAAAGSGDSDEDADSDSEMQEVYVQAYACQIFRDDDAAQAAEDGHHLRPLATSQDADSPPLMLDRFDARWMLDVADFGKEKQVSALPSTIVAEERKADRLRYVGLPSGDHSVVSDILGTFAPTGSYAHESKGGLGDDEEEDLPEVYGYYGRTTSPPKSAKVTWSAISAPQGATAGGFSESGAAEDMSGKADEDKERKLAREELFVPDFALPPGVSAPSSVRQHVMMVTTARNAVRSPQLEVLLRLKQASNEAFAFLFHEDAAHPYYLFLKTWGESALGTELTRQQGLQAARAEAQKKRDEEKAATAARAAGDAKEATSSPPLKDGDSDDSGGAPNLLGGAYDSSGDEMETHTPRRPKRQSEDGNAVALAQGSGAPATRPESISSADEMKQARTEMMSEQELASESPQPDEAKRVVVEKMVAFVSRNGQAFEDRVREREKKNSTFDFLLPTNVFHTYYKNRLARARQDMSRSPTDTPVGEDRNKGASIKGQITSHDVRMAGASSALVDSARHRDDVILVTEPRAGDDRNEDRPMAESGVASKLIEERPRILSACPSRDESIKRGGGETREDASSDISAARSSPAAREASTDVDRASNPSRQKVDGVGEKAGAATARRVGAPEGDDQNVSPIPSEEAAAGDEDPQTRRANRLKRARLMKGHYKLAVLGDGQSSAGVSKDARMIPKDPEHDVQYSSADDISDLDGASDGDSEESGLSDTLENNDDHRTEASKPEVEDGRGDGESDSISREELAELLSSRDVGSKRENEERVGPVSGRAEKRSRAREEKRSTQKTRRERENDPTSVRTSKDRRRRSSSRNTSRRSASAERTPRRDRSRDRARSNAENSHDRREGRRVARDSKSNSHREQPSHRLRADDESRKEADEDRRDRHQDSRDKAGRRPRVSPSPASRRISSSWKGSARDSPSSTRDSRDRLRDRQRHRGHASGGSRRSTTSDHGERGRRESRDRFKRRSRSRERTESRERGHSKRSRRR